MQDDVFTISDEGLAFLAAKHAGLLPETAEGMENKAFERFWSLYQSGLSQKRLDECIQLSQMLKKEREERAKDRARYSRQNLRLAITAALSSIFFSFVTKLLLLL